MALKIFDDKNVSALAEFGKRFQCDVSGTQNFILTIVQLWKILNVKHPLKSTALRTSTDSGETSTVGGETSIEGAKRPGGKTSNEGA